MTAKKKAKKKNKVIEIRLSPKARARIEYQAREDRAEARADKRIWILEKRQQQDKRKTAALEKSANSFDLFLAQTHILTARAVDKWAELCEYGKQSMDEVARKRRNRKPKKVGR